MGIRRCIRLCMTLLIRSLLIWFPALSDEVVGSAGGRLYKFNSNSPIAKDLCSVNKFLTLSYFERYKVLVDLDFDTFMSQEVPCGHCEVLPHDHKSVLRVSNLQRKLIGEGSHRHLSTSIKFQAQHTNSVSEQSSYSCQFVIIERLPSGVFADPFELEHLVHRGVFHDIAVSGDTNLELPSFLSNRSAVEIHLDVDVTMLDKTVMDVELPLHARYQPLNESGYSTVKFGIPDMLVHCSTRQTVNNHSCFYKVINNDTNPNGADTVWNIPCGKKAHAQIVSVFTLGAALLSAFLVVWTSLNHSNIRMCKARKQA